MRSEPVAWWQLQQPWPEPHMVVIACVWIFVVTVAAVVIVETVRYLRWSNRQKRG